MLKNDFLGNEVSRLGFGAMRLPIIGDDQGKIDQVELDKMIDAAISGGINYFDTAYPYHNNMSEIAIGRSLSRYPRESFYLVTKYPGHQITDKYDPEGIFEEQLEKCGVDYFDYYLLHNIYETSIETYMNEDLGIMDYFISQKKSGRIHRLGFSCHGRVQNLEQFLDYGEMKYRELLEVDPQTASLFEGNSVLEFCQIQLNYLDWSLQNAKEKYKVITDRGLPITVMEPLRGGKLVNLNDSQMQQLSASGKAWTPIEWSFRWLQAKDNVKVILSGMSDLKQVEENLKYFDDEDRLSQDDESILFEMAESLKAGVPCTACRYCVKSCPKGIDIPMLLATYNDLQFQQSFTLAMQMEAVPEGHRAQDCIACGLCARTCPQQIDVPEVLAKLAETLDGMPSWAELCKQREEAAAASRG